MTSNSRKLKFPKLNIVLGYLMLHLAFAHEHKTVIELERELLLSDISSEETQKYLDDIKVREEKIQVALAVCVADIYGLSLGGKLFYREAIRIAKSKPKNPRTDMMLLVAKLLAHVGEEDMSTKCARVFFDKFLNCPANALSYQEILQKLIDFQHRPSWHGRRFLVPKLIGYLKQTYGEELVYQAAHMDWRELSAAEETQLEFGDILMCLVADLSPIGQMFPPPATTS